MKQTSMTLFILMLCMGWLSSCGWEVDGRDVLKDEYLNQPGDDDDDSSGNAPDNNLTDDDDDLDDVVVDTETLTGTYFYIENANGYTESYGPLWYLFMYNLFVARINEAQTEMSLTFCNQVVEMTDDEGAPMALGIPGMTYENGSGEEVIMPVIDALPKQTYTFKEAEKFTPDTAYWVWGYHMDDWSDASQFPATQDDAETDSKVFDEDEDGRPGISIHLINPDGFRWLIRRSVQTFTEGTRSSDGQFITGKMESWDWVQHSVGSEGADENGNPNGEESPLLKMQIDIIPRTDTDHPYALRVLGSRDDADEDAAEGQVYAEDEDAVLCEYLRANFKSVLRSALSSRK